MDIESEYPNKYPAIDDEPDKSIPGSLIREKEMRSKNNNLKIGFFWKTNLL